MALPPKHYVIAIHSSELSIPLITVAETLKLPMRQGFSTMGAVQAPVLVEVLQERAGHGVQMQGNPVWQEIQARHRRGEVCSAIVGCPIMTNDVVNAMKAAHIPVPPIDLVTMIPADSYKCMELHSRGISELVDGAASCHNAFDLGNDVMVPVLLRALGDAAAHNAAIGSDMTARVGQRGVRRRA